MKNTLILVMLLVSVGPSVMGAATNTLESLTLEQAVDLAERRHPQLAEARALIDAAEGRTRQAGAWPNPELIGSAQQLPLERGASNQREYVAGVGQVLPLGGRLGKARDAEQLEREVRIRGLEVARKDLRRRVQGAFATALYQERACDAQRRITDGFAMGVVTARARVELGDGVPGDLARAQLELARATVELQRTEAMRDQGRIALAAAMGDAGLRVKSLDGSVEVSFEIPTLESLVAGLDTQPELRQAAEGLRATEARVDLAKAERIPDVRVEALYHRLENTRESTFDIGVSIPLPLFNRNQGKLREARAEAVAAEARLQRVRIDADVRLRQAHAQLKSALANARAFKTEILPHAETILRAAEAGYAAGESSLADVIPVRRDWAALQLTHLESVRDVMQAWSEIAPYLNPR